MATKAQFKKTPTVKTVNSKNKTAQSALVSVENDKNSKKIARKKIICEELVRIFFYVVFWGVCALVAICAFKFKWITNDSSIPEPITHYVSEKMSLGVYAAEVFVSIFVAGLFSIFGAKTMVKYAQEELTRILYTIGTFAGWMSVVLAAVDVKAANYYLTGIIILVGYCTLGVSFVVYFVQKSDEVKHKTKATPKDQSNLN